MVRDERPLQELWRHFASSLTGTNTTGLEINDVMKRMRMFTHKFTLKCMVVTSDVVIYYDALQLLWFWLIIQNEEMNHEP